MGILKFKQKDIARAQRKSEWKPALVEGPRAPHYLSQPKPGKGPVVYLANGRTLIQTLVPGSSRRSDLDVFGQPDDSAPSENLGNFFFGDDVDIETPRSPRKQGGPSPSKQRKADQWTTWQETVIPGLRSVFLELWHKTKGLREADSLTPPSRPKSPCPCGKGTLLRISVVAFTSKPPALSRNP